VEFFRSPNIDFLGKKWYFLAFSLVFSVAGICSMLFWHGVPLGVDFRGGTLVRVKFTKTPNLNEIRGLMDRAGLHSARIQQFGPTTNNEVLIGLAEKETSEAALDQGRSQRQRAKYPKLLALQGSTAPGHGRRPALPGYGASHRSSARRRTERGAEFDG
jgi:preprotein translocase subunit SecF